MTSGLLYSVGSEDDRERLRSDVGGAGNICVYCLDGEVVDDDGGRGIGLFKRGEVNELESKGVGGMSLCDTEREGEREGASWTCGCGRKTRADEGVVIDEKSVTIELAIIHRLTGLQTYLTRGFFVGCKTSSPALG
jgi:hypothetical protein